MTASSTLHRLFFAGSVLLAVGLAILFFLHAGAYPACCDARQYSEMARFFDANGFAANAPHADVRTFGYPLFLALIARVTGAAGLPLTASIFVVQLVLYFGLVVALHRRMAQSYGSAAGAAVFYGLTFNVLLLPYLSLTLTDGFSVILLLGGAYVLLGMTSIGTARSVVLRAAMLGLIVGFAVVVRPANLWFGSLVFIGALLIFRIQRAAANPPAQRQSNRIVLLFIAVAGVAAFAATIPQSTLNWTRARQASPLPIYDIKTKQLEAGLRNLKYATSMVGTPAGIFYRNPLFAETSTRPGIEWYFRNPLRGAGTVALRMFGGFDFDYFFPYIYETRPGYRPLLFVLSQFIVFFGAGGVLLLAFPALARRVLGHSAALRFQWKAPVTTAQVFVPMFVAWGVIYAPSAIENRFALPMITLLMPVAVAAFWMLGGLFRDRTWMRGILVSAGFLAWLALATPLALLLERVKQLPPP